MHPHAPPCIFSSSSAMQITLKSVILYNPPPHLPTASYLTNPLTTSGVPTPSAVCLWRSRSSVWIRSLSSVLSRSQKGDFCDQVTKLRKTLVSYLPAPLTFSAIPASLPRFLVSYLASPLRFLGITKVDSPAVADYKYKRFPHILVTISRSRPV